MDFADATLVALADELGTESVCTTNRRDFGIYRLVGDRPFRILPELPCASRGSSPPCHLFALFFVGIGERSRIHHAPEDTPTRRYAS